MKKERLIPSLVVFILLILLISSGCSVTSSVNVSQNKNSNSNSNSSANSNSGGLTPPPTACSGTLQDIANNINGYLMTEIDNYSGSVPWRLSLQSQKLKGLFKYRAAVVAAPNYPPATPPATTDMVYLYIAGSMGDERTTGKDVFQPFLNILKPFHIRSCVNKIVFVRLTDLKDAPVTTLGEEPIEGFSWFGCDDPNIPCPGGICAPPGSCKLIATPTPNLKTTPTGSLNSNSSSNSNSNSSSVSNSVKPKT